MIDFNITITMITLLYNNKVRQLFTFHFTQEDKKGTKYEMLIGNFLEVKTKLLRTKR